MNFYTSSEEGYQELLTALEDPLDSPGNWHNNIDFVDIHTQSTRVEQFGGGATGGLDDRFDFILISNSLQDNVIPSSYTEPGNDGKHFNLSINNGISDPVIDALYYASDHLPVYCDFVFDDVTSLDDVKPVSTFEFYDSYPNPFNSITTISFYLPRASFVNLVVYNSLGQIVKVLLDQNMSSSFHTVSFEG